MSATIAVSGRPGYGRRSGRQRPRRCVQLRDPRIDYSVYPDLDENPEISTPEDRADYVARICGAWDFGVMPTPETFDLFAEWREIFDRFPIGTSPAYHALLAWYGWPAKPGWILEAEYERSDRAAGREDAQLT